MLPESQMDRFMICLSMGYPSHEDAVSLLKGEVWHQAGMLRKVISLEELQELRQTAEKVYVHDDIYDYVVTLVERTRTHELFSSGASPRACIALLRMSRAMALLKGRDFVTPQDVQHVLPEVVGHRVKLSSRARAEGIRVRECLNMLLREVKPPRS